MTPFPSCFILSIDLLMEVPMKQITLLLTSTDVKKLTKHIESMGYTIDTISLEQCAYTLLRVGMDRLLTADGVSSNE
ncbi:hypothetical protein [Tortoise microvirus 55]|nr:hypothetical protein [Tortoise microvirus 44]QCS37113.1 hypothetical protein [Tortoise microvirus 55]